MASNFRIVPHRENGCLHLSITGDFDGTSAHELVNAMKSCPQGVRRLVVQTDGLKEIHPFGIRTFGAHCRAVSRVVPSLEFAGARAAELTAELPYSPPVRE